MRIQPRLFGAAKVLGRMHIRTQLLLAYLVAILVPVSLLGTYLVGGTRSLVLKQQVSITTAENTRVSNLLHELTDTLTSVSNSIDYDTTIKTMLCTRYSSPDEFIRACQYYPLLDTYINNYAGIQSIRLYTTNDTILDNDHFAVATAGIQSTGWFQNARNSWDLFWIASSDGNNTYLSLVRKIPLYDKRFAVLVISARPSYVGSMLNSEPLSTLASVGGGLIVASGNAADIGQNMDSFVPMNAVGKGASRMGGTALAVSRYFYPSSSEDRILVVTINGDAYGKADRITFVCVLIFLVAILLPLLMIILFSNVFSLRIQMLRNVMRQAARGDLYIAMQQNGRDEISEVYTDINIMIASTRELVQQLYSEKLKRESIVIEQQKIEFQMLASQINPHFLFNTLETIRMKVLANGDHEAANILKLLGKSMRHMLEVRDDLVSLESEIDYIRCYLEIQRFRFGERIAFRIAMGEDVHPERYYLLPLLVQPIVENAFVHGLEAKEGAGLLSVDIARGRELLTVTVEDDGVGMPEEECHRLNMRLHTKSGGVSQGSIGLRNISQRIALYYGARYGVDVESREGIGTKVTLTLPAEWKTKSDIRFR